MESSNLFEISGPIVIDWIYIVSVVLGADVLMRILPNTIFQKYKEYAVLLLAFVIAVFFILMSDTPKDTEFAAKSSLVNYCIATSLYELIIKRIKSYLQNDSSNKQGIESNNL